MKMIKTLCAIGVVAASVNAANVMAKVSAEEAAKLGTTLTPVGATKEGNAAGTIPAWDGGVQAPAGYVQGKPYIDPFADDKPLFEITNGNKGQYADNLSEGQLKMLEKYPSYKMVVYPSRRSTTYPEDVVAFTKKNALEVEMKDGGNGLSGINGVYPFPITDHPIEMLWNHFMRNRGGFITRQLVQVTPTEGGDFTPIKFYEEFSTRYSLKDFKKNKDENVYFYFKQQVTAPARLAGNVLLAHETIDQVKEPRRAWIYNAGQRRVRRAPQVGYDGPGTASDGLRTADNFDGYNGAPDRYDWKFLGKKELYVPFNSYKADDKSLTYKDMVLPGHLNQDVMRYELHRVYVVEGTLKAGQRHIYSKRTFYIEEDTWAILVADHYDGRGELWRHYESHNKNYYDQGTTGPTIESIHDLLSGRYLAFGLANELPLRYDFRKSFKSKDFTPAALRRSGKR